MLRHVLLRKKFLQHIIQVWSVFVLWSIPQYLELHKIKHSSTISDCSIWYVPWNLTWVENKRLYRPKVFALSWTTVCNSTASVSNKWSNPCLARNEITTCHVSVPPASMLACFPTSSNQNHAIQATQGTNKVEGSWNNRSLD